MREGEEGEEAFHCVERVRCCAIDLAVGFWLSAVGFFGSLVEGGEPKAGEAVGSPERFRVYLIGRGIGFRRG